MTKKRQTNVEDSEVKPFSKKDFINNIIKKKQKNKFLSEQQEEYYNVLKDKLIRSGIKSSECEMCGYKERRIVDGKIPLLLNFEDGDISNRTLENLKIYCFNCTFNCGRGYIKRGTIHFNMDPDVIQGAKKPIKARH